LEQAVYSARRSGARLAAERADGDPFASQIDVTDRKRRELSVSEARDRFEAEVQRRTVELREAMAELEGALAARTVLFHEVNHRVKNNLQTISSLIGLQARRQPEGGVTSVLQTLFQRVEALSMVHRRLYAAEDESGFEVVEFTRELAASLVGHAGDGLELEFRACPVVVHAGKATPLALLINEMLGCAIDAAAPNGRVVVDVDCENGVLRLGFFHDGASEVLSPAGPPSFERTLVETVCRQLQAGFTAETADGRSRLQVIVPVNRLQDE
jgi:two-component sensor histidine kinase